VIFSANEKAGIPPGLLEHAFPGATINDAWLPIIDLSPNKLKVARYVLGQVLKDRDSIGRDEFGVKDQSYLKRILEDWEVMAWLEERGITLRVTRTAILISTRHDKPPPQ
jgi:hypothetical protein